MHMLSGSIKPINNSTKGIILLKRPTEKLLPLHYVRLVMFLPYEPHRGKTNNVVSEQVRHKPACTSTERARSLKFWIYCTIRVAKTKALISLAVTAKLICAFVFAYADYNFSHKAAHTRILRGTRNLSLVFIKFLI